MEIYHYSETTGEYLGKSIASESPLEEGIFLIPAWATNVKPYEVKEKQANIFKEGRWEIITDLRGEIASLIDKEGFFVGQYIFNLGEEYRDNIIKGLPDKNIKNPRFTNGKWVETIKEPEVVKEPIDTEKIAMSEAIINLTMQLEELKLKIEGGK